jgi:transposase-like protein
MDKLIWEKFEMPRTRKLSPERAAGLLLQIETAKSCGKTISAACTEAGMSEGSYYQWRRELFGLKVGHTKRLLELEQENRKLKKVVATLSRDKQILQGFFQERG